MNKEIEQNQETQSANQTDNFLKNEKFSNLKAFWTDKITYLHILTLVLQVLFLVLQFLPIMNIAMEAKFSFFGGLKIKTETLSMLGFARMIDEGLNMSLFLFYYVLIVCYFVLICTRTLPYFIRKKDRLGKGFLKVQVVLAFCMLFFLSCILIGNGMANEVMSEVGEYYEGSKASLFSLTTAGNLYWIVGIILFIVQGVLSAMIKGKKEELRMAEMYQKKNEKESV